jgi:hypothetical protein
MTPGEMTMLKILAETNEPESALERFKVAFPTTFAQYAFDSVVKNLLAKRFIKSTKQGKSLALTESGREALTAEHRAENIFLKQDGEGR